MTRNTTLGSTQQAFPVPPDKYQQGWMSVFLAQLSRRLARLSSPYVPQVQLLMIADSGSRYKVTIDDTTTPGTPVFKFTAEDKNIGPTPL